jgi:hypothetical protein
MEVRFREDKQFEGEGVQQPIPDLLPVATTLYEPFMRQVDVGDIFRALTFPCIHVHTRQMLLRKGRIHVSLAGQRNG